jgi:hypothetical protein
MWFTYLCKFLQIWQTPPYIYVFDIFVLGPPSHEAFTHHNQHLSNYFPRVGQATMYYCVHFGCNQFDLQQALMVEEAQALWIHKGWNQQLFLFWNKP